MAPHFYELLADDTGYADRWFLGSPIGQSGREIDPRLFTYGRPYDGDIPMAVAVSHPGRIVEFNFADFDMPVVSNPVARMLVRLNPADVELLPVTVEGMEEGACIVNVISRCVCLDEGKSEILRWSEEDARPDKVGQYRMVTRLTIDPKKPQNHDIFRIDGWRIALIVSERLREFIGQVPNSGVRAERVT
jgi:hypothetical protein